jgi:hypothetical protein
MLYSAETLNTFVKEANTLIDAGFSDVADRLILSLFHKFKLPYSGFTYDTLSNIYRAKGRTDKAILWSDRKVKFLNLGLNV